MNFKIIKINLSFSSFVLGSFIDVKSSQDLSFIVLVKIKMKRNLKIKNEHWKFSLLNVLLAT